MVNAVAQFSGRERKGGWAQWNQIHHRSGFQRNNRSPLLLFVFKRYPAEEHHFRLWMPPWATVAALWRSSHGASHHPALPTPRWAQFISNELSCVMARYAASRSWISCRALGGVLLRKPDLKSSIPPSAYQRAVITNLKFPRKVCNGWIGIAPSYVCLES